MSGNRKEIPIKFVPEHRRFSLTFPCIVDVLKDIDEFSDIVYLTTIRFLLLGSLNTSFRPSIGIVEVGFDGKEDYSSKEYLFGKDKPRYIRNKDLGKFSDRINVQILRKYGKV